MLTSPDVVLSATGCGGRFDDIFSSVEWGGKQRCRAARCAGCCSICVGVWLGGAPCGDSRSAIVCANTSAFRVVCFNSMLVATDDLVASPTTVEQSLVDLPCAGFECNKAHGLHDRLRHAVATGQA